MTAFVFFEEIPRVDTHETNPMTPSAYSLEPEHLRSLDVNRSVEVFRRLLLAETWRFRIPESHVHVSADVTTSDGGIDASIEDLPSDLKSNVIIASTNKYQIKTGQTFKPWTLSSLRDELFGKSNATANRANLKEGIRDCLDEGGSYVIVCFGLDMVEPQRKKAKNNLTKLLKECGYSDPATAVWGIGELRNSFEIYPSLCLEISKRRDGFLSHPLWASTEEEMKRPFQKSEASAQTIEQIRDSLRKNVRVHIRICGEPGVGKTRTILEATQQEDLSPTIVYWTKADDFLRSQQYLDFRTSHANYYAILVIDECDYDDSAIIWNTLKHRAPSIRLVTIHYEFDDSRPHDVVIHEVPSLGPNDITAILQDYGAPFDVALQYSELCSGSPRVAHIIGENLRETAVLTNLRPTIGDVWTRYISGRKSQSSDELYKRKLVISFIALFKKCGFSHPVNDEANAVFQLIKEFEPSIGQAKFSSVVADFKKRRILRGDKTLYITPKLFHVWLWSEWWATHGSGINIVDFSQKLPPSLFGWFGQMFRYAQSFGDVLSHVNILLGRDGPFATSDFIRTDVGARFFLSLAEASPREALSCLERSVGSWEESKLLEFTTGRREVIWALEKIVFYPDLFTKSAALLLTLAEFENERWGNSATGIFKQLFTLIGGELAPTGASPSVRIPLLVEAINSNSKRRRIIALDACRVLLDVHPHPRVIRSVPFGSEHVEPWRPKSHEEVLDAIAFIWKLLEVKAKELPDEDEREQAQTILIQQCTALLSVEKLKNLVFETLEQLATSNDRIKKILTKHILDIFSYEQYRMPRGMKGRLTELRDKLSGNDFASILRRYIGITDWGESLDKDKGAKTAKALKRLAKQSVASPQTLKSELSWATSIEAENSFPFGVELSKADTKHSLLPLLLEEYRSGRDKTFLGLLSGYLKNIYETNLELWEASLDAMAADSLLAHFVAEVTWRTGITERAGERVLELATHGVIGPEHLRMWGFGTEVRKLSPPLFQRWIEFLLTCESPVGRTIGLELFHRYYCDNEAQPPMSSELAKTILLHPDYFGSRQRGGMDDYNWTAVATKLLSQEPDFSVRFLEVVLDRWDSYDASFGITPNRAASILFTILKENPDECWEVISKLIKNLKGAKVWMIMRWLQAYDGVRDDNSFSGFNFLKFEVVSKWIDKSKKSRARFLAQYVPKTFELPAGDFTRQFLRRYGDDQEVRHALMANFATEGWNGEASVHYHSKRNQLASYKTGESNTHFIKFIDEYMESLDKQIEFWRTHEER